MGIKLLNEYQLGDMFARYYIDESTRVVELQLHPAGLKPIACESKKREIDSLVQVKIAGDVYLGGYACGTTMRQSGTALGLKYCEQRVKTDKGVAEIVTGLEDARGIKAEHHVCYREGDRAVCVFCVLINGSAKKITLEMLESFSLGGITPFTEGDAHETLKMHRIRSVWSMEGRPETRSIEDLQLEPSWAGHAVRCEKFGQVGSMPVNHFFPWVMIEDAKNGVFWGAQLAHNASWQMELFRKDDALALSGGLADRDFGQWTKELMPGERFYSPSAIITTALGGTADDAAQRLTGAGEPIIDAGPESEQSLPVMFNEYCTTWGCPSHENISRILEAIKGRGFEYFVIDAGWYKRDGIPWDLAAGDYDVSKTLFPNGLKKTVEAINNAGMTAGVWFEIENVGSASEAYKNEEHLLQKDGATLTTTMRRFWDMRQPWVQEHLREKVIDMLKKYGFGYIKMDYNESVGAGCDGCESLGEGLRQNMRESYRFVKRIKAEIPGIVVENCSSGGHRLEPKMLWATSMSSFSDAHECEEIPIIAANLHRVLLPRQSQIWAVIRKTDSPRRIAYSLTNTFLGRMCVSGDVTELSAEQWALIDKGIAFYKKIAPVIKRGHTYWFGTKQQSYRHPKGWQGIYREGCDGAYFTLHTFAKELPPCVEAELPAGEKLEIADVYAADAVTVTLKNGVLRFEGLVGKSSAAVLFKKA